MRALRITYQVFFFLLFVLLLITMDLTYLKGYPVRIFLEVNPLVGLATSFSTHGLYHGLLWGLLVVALTVLFGRVFCGWICPYGAIHSAASAGFSGRLPHEVIKANQFRPLQHWKYYVLLVLLGMAALGSLQTGLLDPIASLTRSFAVFAHPASQMGRGVASNLWAGPVIVICGGLAGAALSRLFGGKRKASRAMARDGALCALGLLAIFLLARTSPVEPRVFHWAFWIAALFLFIIGMNRVIPHFWCRALCPLGALLGILSRFSLWRMHRDAKVCTHCGRCVAVCAGACDPDGALRKSECLVCMNCRDVCPEKCISFRLLPELEGERVPSVDLGRRRLLGSLAIGVGAALALRTGSGNLRAESTKRIRPPGSVDEEEFLARCIKCGACMKICPTNAIQPAMTEAGIAGLWTPILVFRIGQCEHDCVLCSRVCPTGAIRLITAQEKTGHGAWEGKPIRMGTAFFDRNRCLPWASDRPCVVCEEVCPVSPKAIFTKPTEVTRRDGTRAVLNLPYVDPTLCTGCGMCEKECPIHDERGIRVTSVGETRSRENRMIL